MKSGKVDIILYFRTRYPLIGRIENGVEIGEIFSSVSESLKKIADSAALVISVGCAAVVRHKNGSESSIWGIWKALRQLIFYKVAVLKRKLETTRLKRDRRNM